MSKAKNSQINEFDFLFRKYFNRLLAFANVIISDNAYSKDIVQDAFVSCWKDKDNLRFNTFESYIFKTVKNKCLNFLRDKAIEGKKLSDLKEAFVYEEIYRIDFVKDEPYILIEKELKNKLDKAIELLPPRCKEVFIKSRIEGMKNKEIANDIGINVKNVERHISNGLKQLRVHFADQLPMLILLEIISQNIK